MSKETNAESQKTRITKSKIWEFLSKKKKIELRKMKEYSKNNKTEETLELKWRSTKNHETMNNRKLNIWTT